MEADIALTFGILAVAVALFVTEVVRVDVVALAVLCSLALTGLVGPEQALSGFSNPAVVTVWAMFILSAGLARTGVSRSIGRQVLRFARGGETRLVGVLMTVTALLSAFMNNIGVAAMFLPITLEIARRTKRPPSHLLLPMAYGSLLGGLILLIGTASNLLVRDALREAGFRPLGMFDFTIGGLIIGAASVAWMALIGRRFLPVREPVGPLAAAHVGGKEARAHYGLDERLAYLDLPPDSPLAGKTLDESGIRRTLGLNILDVRRADGRRLVPEPDTVLAGGDRLLILGRLDRIERIAAQPLETAEERQPAVAGLVSDDSALATLRLERDVDVSLKALEDGPSQMVEVMVSPYTELAGKTLTDLRFRERYGVSVLAIWRGDRAYRSDLGDIPLDFGDALLCYGPLARFQMLATDRNFVVLRAELQERPRLERAPLAAAIMAGVVASVMLLGWPISIAAVTGCVLMVLTRCLTMEEAYQSIDWRSVFLIAAMLPLGIAMQQTGAAALVADVVISAVGAYGPAAILAGLMALSMATTQVMPSPVVAVLMSPIALNAAANLGASPYPFMMGIAYALAAAFLSPVAHPANVLVMSPGGYRFTDYVVHGLPISLIVLVISVPLLPLLFPF